LWHVRQYCVSVAWCALAPGPEAGAAACRPAAFGALDDSQTIAASTEIPSTRPCISFLAVQRNETASLRSIPN
jgi:hypothetical protein